MTADDSGSAPEPASGPAHAAPRRAAWRAWRRSRPFWGGLLLLIAGLELIAIPLSGVLLRGAIKLVIYIGIGGVFGVLIGALLVAAGIVLWLNPAHRVFYGIAGIVLGILSFPASNLGGFFLGMLLAIIGGALGFAWEPAGPAPVTAVPEPEPGAGADGASTPGGSPARRMLAVAALPALLVAGMLSAGNAARPADAAQPGRFCILWIICIGSSPSPSPSPSPTSSPAPAPTPSPGQSGSAGRPASGKKASGKAAKRAGAPGGIVASAATSVLTAGTATLSDFNFAGNVTMPVGNGGTEKMMKFTASSATLSGGVTVSVTAGGVTTNTDSPVLSFSGDMTLYATKLCGSLAGIPLCFTPTTVSAVLLKVASLLTSVAPITLTDVTTDQPLALAGGLQTGTLSISQ